MSIEQFWANGVQANEALFTSTCRVTRSGALSGSIDPTTGLESVGAATEVWSGRCWHKQGGWSKGNVAGDAVIVQSPTIALPLDAPALQIGDQIEITGSLVALNVGRKYRVVGLPEGGFITIARYTVEGVV